MVFIWKNFGILSLLCTCATTLGKTDSAGLNSIEDNEAFAGDFIVTSTKVDQNGGRTLIESYQKIDPRIQSQPCDRLDLFIPDQSSPLVVCLRPLDFKKSVFHSNFVLKETINGSESKVTSLNELMQNSNLVDGFVLSFGQSFVSGKIAENGDFYGKILFSNNMGNSLKMCTVSPMSALQEYVNYKDFEDKGELNEFIAARTIKLMLLPNATANSIVSCNDNNQIKDGLSIFDGSVEGLNGRKKRSLRKKRKVPESTITHPGTPPNDNNLRSASTVRTTTYKYLEVFFQVDERILKKRFRNDRSALTVTLSGYVEMTDWITRASDFDGDGTPDNIGFKFAGVEIAPKYEELKGENVLENLRNHKVQQFFKKQSNENKTDQSVTIYMVPLKNPLYLHLAIIEKDGVFTYEGCSACTNGLTGLINPAANRYSSHGETVRMFFATMSILVSSVVYTEKACVGDCTFDDVQVPQSGGDSWGACLLEGSLFDTANIPLNAFRLSDCSLKEGKRCLATLEGRTTEGKCLKQEEEKSYCGNGIVEPGEECDCGTLAMCQLLRCTCGPRNGVLPCMKLSDSDVHICESLIRCRGYRFINEVGRGNGGNGSHVLASMTDLLNYKLPAEGSAHRFQLHPGYLAVTTVTSIGHMLLVVGQRVYSTFCCR